MAWKDPDSNVGRTGNSLHDLISALGPLSRTYVQKVNESFLEVGLLEKQISQNEAEIFAADVLAWFAQDHGRISSFLSWSGENLSNLTARIEDVDFLRAVIEFLLLDEDLLLWACRELEYPPETPMRARAALPGGKEWSWT